MFVINALITKKQRRKNKLYIPVRGLTNYYIDTFFGKLYIPIRNNTILASIFQEFSFIYETGSSLQDDNKRYQ